MKFIHLISNYFDSKHDLNLYSLLTFTVTLFFKHAEMDRKCIKLSKRKQQRKGNKGKGNKVQKAKFN